ncbi:MAG: hypothetical protein B7733_05970 [Myxococcales bacterium FL481]|nr:MAG: hypothetical protein B7733_05970 [Myxococcales bacterium FL481]
MIHSSNTATSRSAVCRYCKQRVTVSGEAGSRTVTDEYGVHSCFVLHKRSGGSLLPTRRASIAQPPTDGFGSDLSRAPTQDVIQAATALKTQDAIERISAATDEHRPVTTPRGPRQ